MVRRMELKAPTTSGEVETQRRLNAVPLDIENFRHAVHAMSPGRVPRFR